MDSLEQFQSWSQENQDNIHLFAALSAWYQDRYQKEFPCKSLMDALAPGALPLNEIKEIVDEFLKPKETMDTKPAKAEVNSAPTLIISEKPTINMAQKNSVIPIPEKTKDKTTFGKYEVLEVLGKGGMGVIYKARHKELNQIYALKTMIAGEHASEASIKRFYREARTIAKLKHPNIVQVIDFGQEGTLYYFVMEYVEGKTLDSLIKGKLSTKKGILILKKSLDGLSFAHRQGVFHRDLKPENIFVTQEGEPKIGDFGLAKDVEGEDSQKLTKKGSIMGTPAYMSPEQASGDIDSVDARSDVYSMGVCLYEMLTKRCPYRGKSFTEIYLQIMKGEAESPLKINPKLSKDIETITLKAIAKEKGKRYQSAASFASDLQHFLDGKAITARPRSTPEKLVQLLKKHRGIFLFITLFLIFTVAFSLFGTWNNQENILAEKLKKFETIVKKIQNSELSKWEKENSIFEIGKFQEKEILEKLGNYVAEGTQYFLTEQKWNPQQVDFYQLIVLSLGETRQKRAQQILSAALEKMSEKVSTLPLEKRNPIQIQYMIHLSKAFSHFPSKESATFFAAIRKELGLTSLFGKETEKYYQSLLFGNKKDYSFESLISLGLAEYNRKEFGTALEFFKKAIDKKPKTAHGYIFRGNSYFQLGNLEEAFMDYRRAFQQNPSFDFSKEEQYLFFVKRYHQLGLGAITKEKWDEALKIYDNLITINPKDAVAFAQRGLVKVKKKELSQAMLDCKTAFELAPNCPNAFNTQGLIHLAQNNNKLAVKNFGIAFDLDRKNLTYAKNFAHGLFKNRNFDKASGIYTKLMQIAPKDESLYLGRGLVKEVQGEYESAEQDYTIVISLNSKSAEGYLRRGAINIALRRYQLAENDLQMALKLKPNYAEAYTQRGYLYRVRNNIKLAMRDFNKAIELDPDLWNAYRQRANLRFLTGDNEGALEDLNKSIRLIPNMIESHLVRGTVLVKLYSKTKKELYLETANQDFKKVLQLDPKNFDAYFLRGLLRRDFLKLNSGAINDFKKALELNPKLAKERNIPQFLKQLEQK